MRILMAGWYMPMLRPYRSRPVSLLETLNNLEIEFQDHLQTQTLGTGDATSLHTSRTLQSDYEQLIRYVPDHRPRRRTLCQRLTLAGNDRDSVRQLLGTSPGDA